MRPSSSGSRSGTTANAKHGPFDIIGDVHGCCDELEQLLQQLGYERNDGGPWAHPAGRKAIFVGDLVDRGPRIVDTLRTVMSMSQAGTALSVPGNHDIKLKRKLEGRDVTVSHGLDRTLRSSNSETPEFRAEVQKFLDGLVSHYVFDEGRLVVAHAGMKAEMQGRGSAKVRDFALFGETTGETDEFGLPVRYNWAAEYRGRASVVYGHTPVPEPEWLNRTINIDTGCVFGGRLTALRWPEKELVSVPAMQDLRGSGSAVHAAVASPLSAQQANDDLLDIEDVRGKRLITTRLHRSVTIREENAAAALEVMSRFAANPKWLIYLPPTMSPSETTQDGRPARASRRGVLVLPGERRTDGRRRAEAHGLSRHRHRVPEARTSPASDSASSKTRMASVTRAPAVGFSRMPRWSASCWRPCGLRSTQGVLGAN